MNFTNLMSKCTLHGVKKVKNLYNFIPIIHGKIKY